MAPSYRTATQTRRGNRSGFPEHDDFEGLPVRQWRQEWVNIAPPPPPETTQHNDRWAADLPHGMPKDFQLLPSHTQELLRAARSGRLYKRPAPAEEDDADGDAALHDKLDKKDDDATEGFMVKVWKQVPRNAEGATISHLAKRHKGTVTLAPRAVAVHIAGPTVTRATVRRIDAAGNPYTQEVIVSEGQVVDGEIISTSIVPAAVATNGDSAAQASTPARRRPPPPKRKGKGNGRAKGKGKGKLPLAASAQPISQGTPNLDGAASAVGEAAAPDGIKTEGENDTSTNVDSEMPDASMLDEDEEGDEGEDEGDEGDEGEGEGEEGNDFDQEETATPEVDNEGDRDHGEAGEGSPLTLDQTLPQTSFQPATGELTPEDEKRPSTSNLLNLAPLHNPPHLQSPRVEGSPLKNVITQSPVEPSPALSPLASDLPAGIESEARAETSTVEEHEAPEMAEQVDPSPQVERALDIMAEDQGVDPTVDLHAQISESMAASHDETMADEPVLGPTAEAVAEEILPETLPESLPTTLPPIRPEPDLNDADHPADVLESTLLSGTEPEEKPISLPEPVAGDATTISTVQEAEVHQTGAPEAKAPSPADVPMPSHEEPMPGQETISEPAPVPETVPTETTKTVEAEDDGPDLLGGLEAMLDQQARESEGQQGVEVPEVTAPEVTTAATEPINQATESAAVPEPVVSAAEPDAPVPAPALALEEKQGHVKMEEQEQQKDEMPDETTAPATTSTVDTALEAEPAATQAVPDPTDG